MDTVCHGVPGSRRAETNEWANMNNAMAYMIPPIIQKIDTASLDIKHGNSTVIYATTRLTPPAAVVDSADHNKECDGNGNIRKRGFQHVYKSNSTNSSRRVHHIPSGGVLLVGETTI